MRNKERPIIICSKYWDVQMVSITIIPAYETTVPILLCPFGKNIISKMKTLLKKIIIPEQKYLRIALNGLDLTENCHS